MDYLDPGKERTRDFATIFAKMWYRDFPTLSASQDKEAKRADWTTHIAGAVKSTADLLGLITRFESGMRTDAVLHDSIRPIAFLGWEWDGLHLDTGNEFVKLRDQCAATENVEFGCLIGYVRRPSNDDKKDYAGVYEKLIDKFRGEWTNIAAAFLFVAIHFERKDGQRVFVEMTIDEMRSGSRETLRTQPAYPWQVAGSKWQK